MVSKQSICKVCFITIFIYYNLTFPDSLMGEYFQTLYFRYILPVIILSVVFNIPKFLEPTFEWREVDANSTNYVNSTWNNTKNVEETEKEYEIGKNDDLVLAILWCM